MMGQTGLFSCFDDIVVCIMVAFIPCYHGSINKAKVDDRVRALLALFSCLTIRIAIFVTSAAGVGMLVCYRTHFRAV
jgi:Cys-rich protein (TIGR01571 family)